MTIDVFTELLTTLVDGTLDEQGETMLGEVYNITTANFSQMTPQDWGVISDRAIQAKWFLDHLKEIKDKFQLLIDGQIAFREFQGWLTEEGYKGAEKIKKAEIDFAVARAKLGATVEQEDYRLTKQSEQYQSETQQEKLLWDNKVIVAVAKKVAAVNAAIERMQEDPEFPQQLADWKDADTNIYKQAALALKYGSHGLSHPSLGSQSYPQISQSNFAQFSPAPISNSSLAGTGTGRTTATGTVKGKDSIKVAVDWSGDIAGKVKGVASQINRGFSRVGSFFGGGN
jgi:hypothetical protein